MSVRHYTTDELLALRNSPLVAKPDNLPSIEQWLGFVYLESDGVREKLRIPHSESANTDRNAERTQSHGAVPKDGGKRDRRVHGVNPNVPEASPMGAFSTGRPKLSTRNSTLRTMTGDDVTLGPPKTVFASSKHNSRLADEPASTDDAENPRAKFFSERQLSRRSGVQEKDGRDKVDSWTLAAERRAQGGDDEGRKDKNDRYGRNDTSDRNGHGDKGDPRWNSNRGDGRRQNGDRPTGGWREREQARRNNGDRHDEREPEWMDESDLVVKKDQELNFGRANTIEEFQKWKESMSRKTKGEPEVQKEEVVEAPPPPPEPKPSLTLDGFEPGGFFAFNSAGAAQTPGSAATPPASTTPAKATGKGKTSRFASMFKPPVEETTPPPPQPETDVQKAANGFARTTAEDQEGFNRVLQMLGGGLKIGGPPTPASESPAPLPSAPQSPALPTRAGTNGAGAKPKSRFFQSQPKSPERMQSPQQGGVQLGGNHYFDRAEPAARPPQGPTMTPEPSNMYHALREQQPRPSSGRVSELAMFDPPSRSAPSPDTNIQNLLAQQRQRPQHHSNESRNLLNLLKRSDIAQQSSRPPSLQTSANPADLQRWLDHQHQPNSHVGTGPNVETLAPRPARLPQQPPGLFEEQLMRNFPSREDMGREQHMPPGIPDSRRQQPQQQRAPPGFYDDRKMMMQQQQQLLQQQQQQMRRNYAEPQTHQAMPPQPLPFRKPQGPPQQYSGDYHIPSPNPSGPPPGFGAAPPPHLMPRHPPGFGGQPPQQHYPQQREPPPPGNMPPGFGPQNGGGPPPGFYGAGPPPPGFQNVRGSMDGSGMPPPDMRGRPAAPYDGYDGRRG